MNDAALEVLAAIWKAQEVQSPVRVRDIGGFRWASRSVEILIRKNFLLRVRRGFYIVSPKGEALLFGEAVPMTHIRFDLTGDDDARLKSLAADMGMSPAAAARELLIGALHDDASRHPRGDLNGDRSKGLRTILRRMTAGTSHVVDAP